MIPTLFIAAGSWLLAGWTGHSIPFVRSLVFGALISPVDPVAARSLFNDGMGAVVFAVILGGALQAGEPSLLQVSELFVVEILGGAVLGLVAAYAGYRTMHRLEEPNLEVLVTLATVMVCYSVAVPLDASGPIAMVAAGLFVANKGMKYAVGGRSRDHVQKSWTLLDEILNPVLLSIIVQGLTVTRPIRRVITAMPDGLSRSGRTSKGAVSTIPISGRFGFPGARLAPATCQASVRLLVRGIRRHGPRGPPDSINQQRLMCARSAIPPGMKARFSGSVRAADIVSPQPQI